MIHFISYSNHKYARSLTILSNESKTFGWFNTITTYGPNDLDNDFKNNFKNILNQDRGGGYWI
jgi:hypothetical protein